MKLKYEKCIRILNNLLDYCHYLGGRHFHTDIELTEGFARISVQAEISYISDEQLRYIDKTLTLPRQFELEQNYWNVRGEDEIDDELLLVGVMVDDSVVEYRDEILSVTVTRIDQPPV